MSEGYNSYQNLKLWEPTKIVLSEQEIFDPSSKFALFSHLYTKTREVYARMPLRRNGESSFLHPINIVKCLQDSGVDDEITLCVGLVHDLVEEIVDLHKKESGVSCVEELDRFEEKVFKDLDRELQVFCQDEKCKRVAREILDCTKLLTRHKRDFYFKSISYIFEHENDRVKEMAIQVKLADRTHNIMTLDSFDNRRRIYACFKNLFILNNAKKYICDKYGDHMATSRNYNSTEILFKRCCKATYEAFLTIGHRSQAMGITQSKGLLHLAFKKYAIEGRGIYKVTKENLGEDHLMRIFYHVVRKWDYRLHHEWEEFEKAIEREREFSTDFFKDFGYSAEQIQAVIDYKDAYALKEVISSLLYEDKYVISRFLHSDLTLKGRIRK